LPRAMRSDVCNRYLCEELDRLPNSTAAVLAVGFDGSRYVRTSVLEGGVLRTVDEAPPAP
ncbi:MAG TPA: hypothetical protein VE981_20305, partial [Planctomycetota bacterium]|nr:hypothetical protein [Planctomycetota bacterium]